MQQLRCLYARLHSLAARLHAIGTTAHIGQDPDRACLIAVVDVRRGHPFVGAQAFGFDRSHTENTDVAVQWHRTKGIWPSCYFSQGVSLDQPVSAPAYEHL
ncbi:hypothetical protein [Xanthomonas campestris]|uniref:hypothetical protein n=1 Tax=Xanthomonas campestris TaxID=339 RepID=UPI0015A38668|nr:hypothetical protein [Xanthomonas campestris]MCF8826233.1 hypothetical protein [Xanthomonas campestris pv. raphani]MEA9892600.1 hypothetical protein [Xanthomonas campestris pv. raphani]MEA9933335.1 hypothetical protein [Xanthomonas campestris pv. raphani]QLC69648.1 hypothetical protein AD14011_09080 [Xanthomonas campestris pv. raphani]